MKKIIIKEAIVKDDEITVIYQFNGVWCSGGFSFNSMLGFGMRINHDFNITENETVIHWVMNPETGKITDLKLLEKFIDHILFKPENHYYLINIELNTDCEGDVLELLEGTKVILNR